MSIAARLQILMLQWLDRRASTLASRLEPAGSAGVAGVGPVGATLEASPPAQTDERAVREHGDAIAHYRLRLLQEPRDVSALLGLAFALRGAGEFREAEEYLRRVIGLEPGMAEAHNSLGYILRTLGRFAHAEAAIRRALEIDPANVGIRKNLGETLLLLGRTSEAQYCFNQILRDDREDVEAILGLAEAARLEGRPDNAEVLLKCATGLRPHTASAWASLASLRKMSDADAPWLKRAQELLATKLQLVDEVRLRFAIGKYRDDVGDYAGAFDNYREANERQKTSVKRYNRAARTRFVDSMIRVYTPEALAHAATAASDSNRPLFVVGMPRSGISVVEQIIASHPAVTGAGELGFWTEVLMENIGTIQQAVLPLETRRQLANDYLRLLARCSDDARRVVDKTPVNSEYLGIIHSVFPQARILYVSRNPLDTCLSCYFQYFSTALSYTMDLSDLAHYYRQHHRQMAHWRSVLPPGAILEVPYEGLVADQEGWVHRILEFAGLAWSDRCLQFSATRRSMPMASDRKVRQRIYSTSVQRWRHYGPYIHALLELQDLREGSAADMAIPAGQTVVSYEQINYSIRTS